MSFGQLQIVLRGNTDAIFFGFSADGRYHVLLMLCRRRLRRRCLAKSPNTLSLFKHKMKNRLNVSLAVTLADVFMILAIVVVVDVTVVIVSVVAVAMRTEDSQSDMENIKKKKKIKHKTPNGLYFVLTKKTNLQKRWKRSGKNQQY